MPIYNIHKIQQLMNVAVKLPCWFGKYHQRIWLNLPIPARPEHRLVNDMAEL